MVLRRVWMSITEPRTIKIVYLCAYVVAVLTGLITLLDPPRSIEGVLGALTTTLWASFILAGGVVALAAVLPGWWWAERLGVWLILAGLAVYALVVLSIHLTEEGSRLTQLGVIIFASFVGIIRLALTKGFTYEPRPHRR